MPEWLTNIPVDFWEVLREMAPYLLFGFFVAGLLSVLISPKFVERHLGGRGIWPVIKASAFGVPLPLCSCGVIPVATSIRRHGASKGATTAFLISTPQTGADSILVTFSLLGGVFAIYRPIAALISGVIGGAIVSATGKDKPVSQSSKCNHACCDVHSKRSVASRVLVYGFITLPRDIGRTLLLGLAAAALISAIVPEGYFSSIVPAGPIQILVLMLVGIPVYICATASIPIAARLILVAGVSPGAAFALLMTGPATNAATLGTIWKIMGKRTCLIYLGTMMVAAFVGGLILDTIVSIEDVQMAMQHSMMPGWIKTASAVILLSVLGFGALHRLGDKEEKIVGQSDETLRFTIKGMTCGHCVATIKAALLGCEGVEAVEVDLAEGRAKVSGSQLDPSGLCETIGELGYSAEAESDGPSPEG